MSATRAWVRAQDPAPPQQQKISPGLRTRVGAAVEAVRLGWEVGTSSRVPPLVRRQPAPSLGVPRRAPTRTKTSNASFAGINPAASTTASSRVKVSYPVILNAVFKENLTSTDSGKVIVTYQTCECTQNWGVVNFAVVAGFRLDTCCRVRLLILLWTE